MFGSKQIGTWLPKAEATHSGGPRGPRVPGVQENVRITLEMASL